MGEIGRAVLSVVAVVLIGLGALLLAAGLFTAPQVLNEYHHHVYEESDQVAADGEYLEFETLSSEGKRVIREGRNASDGDVSVPVWERPPEFHYPPDTGGYHLVHHDGRYYAVATTGTGWVAARHFVAVALSVGVTLALAGLVLRRRLRG